MTRLAEVDSAIELLALTYSILQYYSKVNDVGGLGLRRVLYVVLPAVLDV